MRIYKIASKKYKYLGQCDKLRCNQDGEEKWKKMMEQASRIRTNFKTFAQIADLSPLLDEGEDPLEFLQGLLEQDSSTYLAGSYWGETPVVFIGTCGFEFIFEEAK